MVENERLKVDQPVQTSISRAMAREFHRLRKANGLSVSELARILMRLGLDSPELKECIKQYVAVR